MTTTDAIKALLDLYAQVKAANDECENDFKEPLFESEVAAIDAAISPDMIAALSAIQPASKESEPVAWLEKSQPHNAWFLAYSKNPDAETKPLYTHPPALPPMSDADIVESWLSREMKDGTHEDELIGFVRTCRGEKAGATQSEGIKT